MFQRVRSFKKHNKFGKIIAELNVFFNHNREVNYGVITKTNIQHSF